MNEPSLKRFLNDEEHLLIWPKKKNDKELVIAYLASKFEFNRSYHENEINMVLKEWHVFSN